MYVYHCLFPSDRQGMFCQANEDYMLPESLGNRKEFTSRVYNILYPAVVCFPHLNGCDLQYFDDFVRVLFSLRELREKIQPEIMELIKQQRLNRLCEGTCFRKISSRRRQGETHSVHIHDTPLCIQAYCPSTAQSQSNLCWVHKVSSSVSTVCFLFIHPLCAPLIAVFPLRYENPTGDMRSLKLWTAVKPL